MCVRRLHPNILILLYYDSLTITTFRPSLELYAELTHCYLRYQENVRLNESLQPSLRKHYEFLFVYRFLGYINAFFQLPGHLWGIPGTIRNCWCPWYQVWFAQYRLDTISSFWISPSLLTLSSSSVVLFGLFSIILSCTTGHISAWLTRPSLCACWTFCVVVSEICCLSLLHLF